MVGTILVTGATGTVGGEVVKQLSSTGQKVRASVRSITRVTSNNKLKDLELMEMDYNKPETLVTAFKGADKLFLLTPVSPETAESLSKRIFITSINRSSRNIRTETNILHTVCQRLRSGFQIASCICYCECVMNRAFLKYGIECHGCSIMVWHSPGSVTTFELQNCISCQGCFQHARLIIIIDPIVPFSELRMLDPQPCWRS